MQVAATQPRQSEKRPLLLAAGFGLLAAVLVVVFLSSSGADDAASPLVATTSVVVAKQDLAAGAKVTADALELKTIPQAALSPGVVQAREDAIGKTVRYPVTQGEQLTTGRLVQPPNAQILSFQIPPGLRAMTIPVSTNNTPAALIAPGDFVDILVSTDASVLSARAALSDLAASGTLLQNIQVLTVDKSFVADGAPYDASVRGQAPGSSQSIGFVTLAVLPEQAQSLWLAQDRGKLTLTLRPFGESDIVPLVPKIGPLAP